jgi:type III pantothenate kinase
MIASDTHSSISIGLLIGIQSEIEGMINRYEKIYKNLKVIITGGDSIFLSGNLKNTIFTNSNFIYRGLNYLIEYNQVNE